MPRQTRKEYADRDALFGKVLRSGDAPKDMWQLVHSWSDNVVMSNLALTGYTQTTASKKIRAHASPADIERLFHLAMIADAVVMEYSRESRTLQIEVEELPSLQKLSPYVSYTVERGMLLPTIKFWVGADAADGVDLLHALLEHFTRLDTTYL
jgi:hypothetical protein